MCVTEWDSLPHEFFAFLCAEEGTVWNLFSDAQPLKPGVCFERTITQCFRSIFKINRRSLLAKPVQGFYLNDQVGKVHEMATEVLFIKRDKLSELQFALPSTPTESLLLLSKRLQ